MLYFTSAPVPAKHVPAEIMAGIKKLHGSYEEYNRKLRESVNTDYQIDIFERVVSEDFLWSLYDTNVTLYSGQKMAEVLSGVPVPFAPEDFAAMASKVNGVAYIAIDIDPIVDAIACGKEGALLTELVESVVEHELVHVLQMERGDLDYVDDGIMWKGRLYTTEFLQRSIDNAKKSNDPDALLKQQLLLPWEVEAYAVSTMDKDLEELFKGTTLKLMQKARKSYLSSVTNRSRPVYNR